MANRTTARTEAEQSELTNARRLVSEHGDYFHYLPELHYWLIWDGRRWKEDLTGEVVRYAKGISDIVLDEARFSSNPVKATRFAVASQSKSGIENMIRLAQTELDVSALVSQLDVDPWTFNVRNGTLDLRTGELHDHRPTDLLTKISDVIYDPDAQCPLWISTLDGIFQGDQSLVDFLQRFTGYSLSGIVSEQVMAFLWGLGANGKTTLVEALRRIMGDYGISLAADVLVDSGHDQHSTSLTDLRGARFVVATETGAGRKFNEVLIKQLTGSDRIKARRMRTDNIEFSPTHKLWLHGNYRPRIQGTDHAIWRRLAMVPFEATFAIDPSLETRLLAEASGILAWAVQGCKAWQLDGLQIPPRIIAATKSYREAEDQIGRFIADVCKVGESFHVTSKALYAAYSDWCEEQGERGRITGTALGLELSNRGYELKHTRTGNAWLGLGLAADETLEGLG